MKIFAHSAILFALLVSTTPAVSDPAEDAPQVASDSTMDAEELASPKRSKKSPKNNSSTRKDGRLEIHVPGLGPIYYYEPIGPGRLAMRPVLMYLHGRGGDAARDCALWARVARALGWLVCPSGPSERGAGRSWNNNWAGAKTAVMGALRELRKEHGRRVQLYGNTIIGFSEGAYVAMNIGIREPRSFNRLLILAANTKYWGAQGRKELEHARSRLKRVYLITGERDEVIEETRTVRGWLREVGVRTRITTPSDMGHELAIAKKPELYRMALVWLQSGQTK